MLPKRVLYYGKDEPLPEQKHLRAGPLSLVYEAGDLRYIKLVEQEILRRVYVAVRDHNWDTILPVLSNVQMDIAGDAFRISYEVENRRGEIDFFWRGTISGDLAGTISFSMAGRARSTFRRNRIGFCILHPMACASVPGRIEHVDGVVEEAPFPRYIAPQLELEGKKKPVYPFANMRALSHQVRPGLWAEVRFEGDIFELEDQRNWTDASYKTYCTSLDLPFPVEVKQGSSISQSVTLSLRGEIPASFAETSAEPLTGLPPPSILPSVAAGGGGLTFSLGRRTGSLPRLGLGLASHGQPLGQKELDRLKALHLAHLRVDLNLANPDYKAKLRRAATEARSLAASLEAALFLSNAANDELKDLAQTLEVAKPPVATWLVFHHDEKTTGEQWVRLARKYLANYDPAAKIGAGSNLYFTELNCQRPPTSGLDLVSYSLNPQVHAFDNASLVETLAAQAATVESARQFTAELPLAISPITLQPRFNPNATGPEPEPEPGELPSAVDVRQMSLFGAGWTAGSLKYISESQVYSATYYETSGWRGVLETEAGSPSPEKFRSSPGMVFPLYHLLADVAEFAGGEVISTTSSDPLRLDGLALRRGDKMRLILANLSSQPQPVTIQNLPGRVSIRQLDETNVEQAMQSPEAFRAQAGQVQQTSEGTLVLKLLPYGLARIDSIEQSQREALTRHDQ